MRLVMVRCGRYKRPGNFEDWRRDMRALGNVICATAAAAAMLVLAVAPATAACTRLGFSVNDYGKEGPTNDAKAMLDKYIEKKMAERGVTKYRVGKKDVSCELFIDLILFDEHTCRADATVCWDDTPLPKGQEAAAPKKKPVEKSAAAPEPKAEETPATTTGSIETEEAPGIEGSTTPADAPEAASSESEPAAASSDASAPMEDAAPVEASQP
jgi:hypothetical protein